jgi:Rrf2 family protein
MNTRFAVAVHVLTLLDQSRGEPVTSEYLAGSVNTNPSLIRRLLTQLARAGLTTSQMGTGGGALLAKPASSITLLDVYRAMVEDEGVIPMHSAPNPDCPVGRNIQGVLESRLDAAERAMEQELAQTTIADLTSDVTRRERRRRSAS